MLSEEKEEACRRHLLQRSGLRIGSSTLEMYLKLVDVGYQLCMFMEESKGDG